MATVCHLVLPEYASDEQSITREQAKGYAMMFETLTGPENQELWEKLESATHRVSFRVNHANNPMEMSKWGGLQHELVDLRMDLTNTLHEMTRWEGNF